MKQDRINQIIQKTLNGFSTSKKNNYLQDVSSKPKEEAKEESKIEGLLKQDVQRLTETVYQNSLKKYDQQVEELESRGNTFHLKRNLEYSTSIKGTDSLSSPDDIKALKAMEQRIKQVDMAKQKSMGPSFSFLDEQDEEIFKKFTVEEIVDVLNP
jgi:hypothetical protein